MKFVLLALVVEALVTNVAWAIEGEFNWKRLVALALGPVLAAIYQVDLLAYVGLQAGYAWGQYVGYVLTGVLAARGANAAYDLLTMLTRAAHAQPGEGGSPFEEDKKSKGGAVL